MKRLLAAAIPMRLRGRFRRLHPDHAIAARAFDAGFYLKTYPDVGEVGADPLDHFMTYGWREGRDPSPDFSVRTYLEAFPEVAESGFNPFIHWITNGRPRAVQVESPYGFRYDVIARLKPIEARIPARFDGVADPEVELAAALLTSRGRLARLHVTVSHDDYSANLGGLQAAIQREAARLKDQGRDHLHLYPAAPWPVVRTAADPEALGVVWNGEAVGVFEPAAIARALAAAAGSDASRRSFAIHSLLGHAADETVDILKAAGLTRGVFWLHDFASLCAGFHLLRNDVEDCGAPPPGSAACNICVYGPWRGRHLAEHARLFERLELTVAAPSRTTLDLWTASTNLPVAGTVVLPHATLVAREPAPPVPERPLRIAYAGLPVTHKGWPIFRTLASRFAGDPRYEFHHLGARGDATLPATFQPVSAGPAQPLAMRDALQATGIDAVLAWPLCRETFSFVAYEAVAAGCAVITGPDSGNVAAFVTESGHGRVLDEAALTAAFESGAILDLGRARRSPMLYDLRYSALTLDLAAAASE